MNIAYKRILLVVGFLSTAISVAAMESIPVPWEGQRVHSPEALVSAFLTYARSGEFEGIKNALEKGVSPDSRDESGNTALILASSKPLDSDSHFASKPALFSRRKKSGLDFLEEYYAAQNNQPVVDAEKRKASERYNKVLKILLKYGADINALNESSYTALHLVVEDAVLDDRMSLLLENGASIRTVNRAGKTVLSSAKRSGNKQIFELILDRCKQEKDSDGRTYLHWAVANRYVDDVAALAGEVDVNAQDKDGKTPLHIAAQMGSVDIAEILLSHGADPRLVSNYQETPLLTACLFNQAAVGQLLLKNGALTLPLHRAAGDAATSSNRQADNMSRGNAAHSNLLSPIMQKLVNNRGEIAATFFSPEDDLRSLLLSLINSERKRIRIAVYSFTDKAIAQAVHAAHRRGVSIECIVDKGYEADAHSKVGKLAQSGIPTWVYITSDAQNAALMHNKFALFEDTLDHRAIIWTGSYNFTKSASDRNQENAIILDDPLVFNRFSQQFEFLKTQARRVGVAGERGEDLVFVPDPFAKRNEKSRKFERNRDGMGEDTTLSVQMNLKLEKEREARKAFYNQKKDFCIRIINCAKSGDLQELRTVLACMLDQMASRPSIPGGWSTVSGNSHSDTVLLRDEHGRTAFHWAALNGYAEIIELLLDHMLSFSFGNIGGFYWGDKLGGRSPHSLAAEHNQIEALKMLCSEKWVKIMGNDCIDRMPPDKSRDGMYAPEPYFDDPKPVPVKTIDLKSYQGRTPLHWGSYEGHNEIVTFLLSIGVNVNAIDSIGCTALGYAKAFGYSNIEAALLAGGANTAGQELAAIALLEKAAIEGDLKRVALLHANGVDVNHSTALQTASGKGHRDVVSFLLDQGASLKACTEALPHAVAAGHQAVAEILLDHGADINGTSFMAKTPLSWAIWKGDLGLVTLLIARGAGTSLINKDSKTALQVAQAMLNEVSNSKPANNDAYSRIIELLKSVDSNGKLLIEAAKEGDKNKVEQALASLVDIHTKDEEGFTALHWAVIKGHNDLAGMLLTRGADCRTRTVAGSTALHFAAIRGDNEMVELLLRQGADIMAKNNDGDTPMHYAAVNGRRKTILLLRSRGADINAVNLKHISVLHFACRGKDAHAKTSVEMLLDCGANINGAAADGRTPLHYAAEEGLSDIVELLLRRGANIRAVTKDDKTVVHLAAKNGHTELVAYLSSRLTRAIKGELTPHKLVTMRKKLEEIMSSAGDAYGDDVECWIIKAAKKNKSLRHGADHRLGAVNIKDRNGITPLIAAAASGAEMLELLRAGANVDACDNEGRTAIYWAAIMGNLGAIRVLTEDLCKLLQEKGLSELESKALIKSNINIAAYDGTTPLMVLTQSRPEMIEILIDYGADSSVLQEPQRISLEEFKRLKEESQRRFEEEQRRQQSKLLETAKQQQEKIAEKQLQALNDDLLEAARCGDVKQIEWLLAKGADIRATSKEGWSVLHMAVTMRQNANYIEVVRLLLPLGAHINAVDVSGQTPLHWAVSFGLKEVVEFLLQHGADPNAVDKDLQTVLHIAAKKSVSDVAMLFEDFRKSIKSIVELLLKYGAPVNAKDKYGATALVRAGANQEICELLRSKK